MAVSRKMRNEKRKQIIKCCGRYSCTNVKPKKNHQIKDKNASKSVINGDSKIIRRQTTTSISSMDTENQKLSPSSKATLLEDTTLAATIPTDGTTPSMDTTSSEIISATNPDTPISTADQNFPSDSPSTKESPAAASLIPATSSSTTVSVSTAHSSTIGDNMKGIFFYKK
jgi:hypothetical protein